MKIILFESVDKVGKTLIIQKMKEVIKQNNKIPIIFTVPYEIECKNSNDTTERLKLSNILLDKMINRYNDNYICLIDWHHISEMAYGNKLRDGYNTETCKAIDFSYQLILRYLFRFVQMIFLRILINLRIRTINSMVFQNVIIFHCFIILPLFVKSLVLRKSVLKQVK